MIDKKFRLARLWSNKELRKFAHLFKGDIINVSAWKDLDKEGGKYRDYFNNCKSYHISNFNSVGKGIQKIPGEIFLNLEEPLPNHLHEQFDVVFNHTTLEHIYNVKQAFSNLCKLTRDIVIIIVPFIQQAHGIGFSDFWRFTPESIKKMFIENKLSPIYISYNPHKRSSIYIFAIGTKKPDKWDEIKNMKQKPIRPIFLDPYEQRIGSRAIINSLLFRIKMKILNQFKKNLYY